MAAYYNEIDPFAAEWLRQLIQAGAIAPGEVDERSIADVRPNELAGFTQCHFFTGIGVWSYALRQAGWLDDRPVWTGSCPCQSFSAAGKGLGFDDPRHLWPVFHHLIDECSPVTVFGEQVEAAIRHGWLDLVQTDLENSGYACGSVVFPACGIGAPHIRSRLYWVADSAQQQLDRTRNIGEERGYEYSDSCNDVRVADSKGEQRTREMHFKRGEPFPGCKGVEDRGRLHFGGLADTNSSGLQPRSEATEATRHGDTVDADGGLDRPEYSGPTNGQWRDADWLLCRDGKWRPVESGSFEMADRLADRLGYSRIGDRYSLNPLIEKAENRVGRLRGYGNAIVAQQAQAFIEAFISTINR